MRLVIVRTSSDFEFIKIFVLQAQCKHFKNPKVFKAFKAICVDEMLLNKTVPSYDSIIDTLDKAISEVGKSSKPVQFHWLTGPLSSGSFQV